MIATNTYNPASTSDGAALLRAILSHPEEDTPRLMFADWLDEHGEPERAEFIRAQQQLALHHRARRTSDQINPRREGVLKLPEINRLNLRLRALRTAHEAAWAGTVLTACGSNLYWTWERGFVSGIHLDPNAFFTYARDIFLLHPIVRVELRGRDPLVIDTDGITNPLWHARWFRAIGGDEDTFSIPEPLWGILLSDECEKRVTRDPDYIDYPSAGAAFDSLSRTCVQFGRSVAQV